MSRYLQLLNFAIIYYKLYRLWQMFSIYCSFNCLLHKAFFHILQSSFMFGWKITSALRKQPDDDTRYLKEDGSDSVIALVVVCCLCRPVSCLCAQAAHRSSYSSIYSGSLRSCCQFKLIHLLLFAVIAFSCLLSTVYMSR